MAGGALFFRPRGDHPREPWWRVILWLIGYCVLVVALLLAIAFAATLLPFVR